MAQPAAQGSMGAPGIRRLSSAEDVCMAAIGNGTCFT